jgi:hypothetical protein
MPHVEQRINEGALENKPIVSVERRPTIEIAADVARAAIAADRR